MDACTGSVQVLKDNWGNFLQLHGLALHKTLFTTSSSDVVCWVDYIFNDLGTDYNEILQLLYDKMETDKIELWNTGQDNLSTFYQTARDIVPSNLDLKTASDGLFLLMILLREQIKYYSEEKDSIQRVAEKTALYFISILKRAIRQAKIKRALMFTSFTILQLMVWLFE